MTRPPHITAAIQRLTDQLTPEHEQRGTDLWIALRYIHELEDDNADLEAGVARFAASVAAVVDRVDPDQPGALIDLLHGLGELLEMAEQTQPATAGEAA